MNRAPPPDRASFRVAANVFAKFRLIFIINNVSYYNYSFDKMSIGAYIHLNLCKINDVNGKGADGLLVVRTSMSDFRKEEWLTILPLHAISELAGV